jgi:hypothetical protein
MAGLARPYLCVPVAFFEKSGCIMLQLSRDGLPMILRPLMLLLALVSIGLVSPTIAEAETVSASSTGAGPSGNSKKAIVSFISPGHLFPVEGTVFSSRKDPLLSETYRPLAAYDKPHGVRIGDVKLANVECIGSWTKPSCGQGFDWYLQLEDGQRHSLAVAEYSYETSGLLSYAPSVPAQDGVWSEIPFPHGSFWVVTPAEAVITYEQVAYLIARFDQWCSAPGSCTPVSQQMADEVQKVAEGKFQLLGCFQEAYSITGIVGVNKERFYEVTLSAVEQNSPEPQLPKSGYIPVRNLDRSHTGTFYSRGC